MKNAFYFVLKGLFILKIFKFCPDFLGHAGTRLDQKTKVNFKFYAVTNWGKLLQFIYCPISQEIMRVISR